MKRFLRFECFNHYPYGGARDFVNDFDTIEEAMSAPVGTPVKGHYNDDVHYEELSIIDTGTGEIWVCELPQDDNREWELTVSGKLASEIEIAKLN